MCVSTQGERRVDEVEYASDEYEAMSDESHMQEAVVTKKPDEEDVSTKDDNDEVPVSNKSATETIEKMSGEIDDSCFSIIAKDFTLIRVKYMETRMVEDQNEKWRRCDLLKPNLSHVPLTTLSDLKGNGRECIILRFGDKEYEGLDYTYSVDEVGTLWDDYGKIISHKMHPDDETTGDTGLKYVESRKVLDAYTARWRCCYVLEPDYEFCPLKIVSKLQESGRKCVILWFEGEQYEGLDFTYSMDQIGTLWNGDGNKIVSR